MITGLRP